MIIRGSTRNTIDAVAAEEGIKSVKRESLFEKILGCGYENEKSYRSFTEATFNNIVIIVLIFKRPVDPKATG